MRTQLSLCLLLILGATCPPAAQAQSKETIVFSPHQKQDVAISKALLKAKSSIYMALYSISAESDWVDKPSDETDADAMARWRAFREKLDAGEVKVFDMIRKKSLEEGVKCRLILHRAALDSWAIDSAKAYQDVGVDVRWTHKTMHNKFAVVDKKTLINGSGNWSRGAAERYSENTTIFEGHRRLVWSFLKEFYFLWYRLAEQGKAEVFDRDNLPTEEPNVKFFVSRKVKHYPKRAVEAYFTSENGSRNDYVVADKIIEEMRGAKKSIHIMVNHFNMAKISRALIKIHEAKNKNADPSDDIDIQVLMDLGEYDAGKIGISRARDLEQAGITCRYKTYSLAFYYRKAQFMHHKVMIVDGDRMITGSYNWSRTAEHKNYENITVHQGPTQQDLIGKMKGEFDRLWDLRRDLIPDATRAFTSKAGDPGYKRVVPVHFVRGGSYFHTPMTLTSQELDAIRKPLEALGYTPPAEGDPMGHDELFFDKETGTFTSADPGGTFVKDEDKVRTTPAGNSSGLVGAVPGN